MEASDNEAKYMAIYRGRYKLSAGHWDVLRAIDFTTVEVWTKGGLVIPAHHGRSWDFDSLFPRPCLELRVMRTPGRHEVFTRSDRLPVSASRARVRVA